MRYYTLCLASLVGSVYAGSAVATDPMVATPTITIPANLNSTNIGMDADNAINTLATHFYAQTPRDVQVVSTKQAHDNPTPIDTPQNSTPIPPHTPKSTPAPICQGWHLPNQSQDTADTTHASADIVLADNKNAKLLGNANLDWQDYHIQAQAIHATRTDGAIDTLNATHAIANDGRILLSAQNLHIDKSNTQAYNLAFADTTTGAHGTAQNYTRTHNTQGTRHVLNDLMLSPCAPDARIWQIDAKTLSHDGEVAYMKEAVFSIKGVPLVYLPRWSMPITSKPRTGILMPSISLQHGRFGVGVPFYWRALPNADALLYLDLNQAKKPLISATLRHKNALGQARIFIAKNKEHNAISGDGAWQNGAHTWGFSARHSSNFAMLKDLHGQGGFSQNHLQPNQIWYKYADKFTNIHTQGLYHTSTQGVNTLPSNAYNIMPMIQASASYPYHHAIIHADALALRAHKIEPQDTHTHAFMQMAIERPLNVHGIDLRPSIAIAYQNQWLPSFAIKAERDFSIGNYSLSPSLRYHIGKTHRISPPPIYLAKNAQDIIYRPARYFGRADSGQSITPAISARYFGHSAQAQIFLARRIALANSDHKSDTYDHSKLIWQTQINHNNGTNLLLDGIGKQANAHLLIDMPSYSARLSHIVRASDGSAPYANVGGTLKLDSQNRLFFDTSYHLRQRRFLRQNIGYQFENCCFSLAIFGGFSSNYTIKDTPSPSIGMRVGLGFDKVRMPFLPFIEPRYDGDISMMP